MKDITCMYNMNFTFKEKVKERLANYVDKEQKVQQSHILSSVLTNIRIFNNGKTYGTAIMSIEYYKKGKALRSF